MQKELDAAIKALTEKCADKKIIADQALKYTQAALNLANVKHVLASIKEMSK